MAYMGTSPVEFPSFERSRNYFRTGLGGPPAARYAEPPQLERWGGSSQRIAREGTGAGGGGGITSPTPTTPAAPTGPPQGTQPPQTTAPQVSSPAPHTGQQTAPQQPYTAPTLGYGTYQGGPLETALFSPVQQAAQQGLSDVERFAEQFRQQAGPSRTYEGIGGQQTLASAVEGGPMDPARALVGARYTGPAGLDPNAVAGLQFLQGQLEQRQKSLGTGAGLTTTIGQTVQDLTPGEARFEARHLFTPEYRAALQAAMAPVGQFGETFGQERAGAEQFAAQRGAEESDIAQRAAEYLTGRRGGITGDIEQQLSQAQAQQIGAGKAFQDILGLDDTAATIEALRKAGTAGYLAPELDPNAFMTPGNVAQQGFQQAQAAILARYPGLEGVPIGQVGVDKKGRQTYLIPDEKGELVDFRQVLGKTPKAVEFKERQAALEEAFSPARGVPFASGARPSGDRFGEASTQALVNPLYFGSPFEGPQIQSYLTFDPGIRPSRGNVSTEDQRNQYNRIQDLLGELDRIEAEEGPWKAAMIGGNAIQYLEDEIAALESQKGNLSQSAKEWFNKVKRLRKDYRKHEERSDWAKISGGDFTSIIQNTAPLTPAKIAT